MVLKNFEHEDKMQYGLQQLFIGSFLVLNDDSKLKHKIILK